MVGWGIWKSKIWTVLSSPPQAYLPHLHPQTPAGTCPWLSQNKDSDENCLWAAKAKETLLHTRDTSSFKREKDTDPFFPLSRRLWYCHNIITVSPTTPQLLGLLPAQHGMCQPYLKHVSWCTSMYTNTTAIKNLSWTECCLLCCSLSSVGLIPFVC